MGGKGLSLYFLNKTAKDSDFYKLSIRSADRKTFSVMEKKGDKETTTEMKKADLMKMLKKKKDKKSSKKRKSRKTSKKKSRKSRKKRKSKGLDINELGLEGLTLVGGKRKRRSKKGSK